jgi:hypothetical protein
MNQKRVVTEEPQDPFVEKVNRAVAYAKERSVLLGFAALAIAAAVLAGVWLATQRRGAVISDYIAIHNAMEGFDKALQATGETRKVDLGNVVTNLSKITDKKSLPRARFFRARAAYEKGDFAEAAKLFQEVAKPANSVFGLYAQVSVGVAHEAQKKYAEAAQAYADDLLAPFRDVPGYEDALTEAAFGRARVARQLGHPDDARAAYESVTRRYVEARDKAIAARKDELVSDAKSFLTQVDASATESDLTALHGKLDAWIQTTLQKPEAERRRLEDAIRIQRNIEDYLKALADARKAEDEGRTDSALYSYDSAMGDRPTSPTREQYQRAQLELERLALMGGNAPSVK